MKRAPKSHRPIRAGGLIAAVFAAVLVVAACEPVPPTEAIPTNEPIVTAAAVGDIGWEGPSYQGASGSPSASKPESKLWFNDGKWWAELWDTTTSDFYIHRLDINTKTWVRTSTRLDDRATSRSDTLWDGTHLFVASHQFAEGSSSTASAPAYLRRYSYQASTGTYTLDAGFPVLMNNAKSETLVIDEDSQGRIWASWTEDTQVMVAVSSVGGSTWGTPFALPVANSRVASDDISSILAFGGNRIGVLWSNQNADTMYFSQHLDSAPAGTWGPAEVAYTGASAADDHINLKNVADQNGRILAAIKTSRSGSNPLNVLLDRSATGTWSSSTFGLASDNHTRPIVVVDREHAQVQMFATSGQSGGSIYRKTAPLSNISFPAGLGTPVLTDADSADINNPTSTKQAVDSTTGLVVLATNDTTRNYWTHYDPLGGTDPPTPTAPVASFTAAPTTGNAPLDVTFTDTSTNTPTSWAWEFGDGGTSTLRNPVHQYLAGGSYTVTLRATNAGGTGTSVRTNLITVSTPPTTTTPEASFTATPTTGTAPLDVAFTDTSTNTPTSWAWEFGDLGTSTLRNPVHRYLLPGTYTVTLRATNAAGTGTSVRTNLITVGTPPPTGTPVTLLPVADATVKSSNLTKNYGKDKELRTRSGDPASNSYLRFDATGVGTPSRAVLRLFVTDASKLAGLVSTTSTLWGETTITWGNAPPALTQLKALGTIPKGWIEIDVTSAVSGTGPVAFALTGTGTDSAIFSSREGLNAPQLVITPGAIP